MCGEKVRRKKIDITPAMLEAACEKAEEYGCLNTEFIGPDDPLIKDIISAALDKVDQ